MNKFPGRLTKRLEQKKTQEAYRSLGTSKASVDFCSNDYLGFARSQKIYDRANEFLAEEESINGATGSRLLSGNHDLYRLAEDYIQKFHRVEAALIYNSGYDANVGFFSAVPNREDLVLYDEFIHASIRDGILMSRCKAFKFTHNDLTDLKMKIDRSRKKSFSGDIYIVTESVFSMDGDSPDLKMLISIAESRGCYIIIDEAHALGVFGEKGEGLVQKMELQDQVFARIVTFGKALGVHGAAVLGSKDLKDYLVNFSRSLIYSTALPPHSVASILAAYENLNSSSGKPAEFSETKKLEENIAFFKGEIQRQNLQDHFTESRSAIQICRVSGNEKVKAVAAKLQKSGFEVKPILSPTVPPGKECLRFCLHSFNKIQESSEVLRLLKELI